MNDQEMKRWEPFTVRHPMSGFCHAYVDRGGQCTRKATVSASRNCGGKKWCRQHSPEYRRDQRRKTDARVREDLRRRRAVREHYRRAKRAPIERLIRAAEAVLEIGFSAGGPAREMIARELREAIEGVREEEE